MSSALPSYSGGSHEKPQIQTLDSILHCATEGMRPWMAFACFSNPQYELQSREFAPDGRELSALKPANRPPQAACLQASNSQDALQGFAPQGAKPWP